MTAGGSERRSSGPQRSSAVSEEGSRWGAAAAELFWSAFRSKWVPGVILAFSFLFILSGRLELEELNSSAHLRESLKKRALVSI